MFRFIRPRRSIFSMSRLPLKLEAQHQRGELVDWHTVGFKKPRIRAKKVMMFIFAGYALTTIYTTLVLDPLARAAADTLQALPDEELEEEPPIFIPFPGTTKQLPLVPYRGSDPEWQEFVKFSKDKARHQKLREEVTDFVQKVVGKTQVLKVRCGEPMTLRRHWLDIDFPPAPPPLFERKGLELGSFEVTTRPVDSLTVFKIRNALWPTAVMQSFWSFTKVVVADESQRLAGMLGIRSSTPLSIDQLFAQQQQLLKGGQAPQLPTNASTPTQVSDAPRDRKERMAEIRAEREAFMKLSPAEKREAVIEDAKKSNLKNLAIRDYFLKPITAFKAKLAQTWRPVPNYPPRGSLIISGLVELESPKAMLVFDVRAAWDPKTREFDSRSMSIKLRRFQQKKQSPQRL
ncbi:hypothetical protein VTL71DRAFT_5055 [Oculimacula yallundae]|uniref:Uncharacterized protein n=1 Tax=Oculimacula yallundae TaxID=86028 RepID=A0ABR4C021_9HELO